MEKLIGKLVKGTKPKNAINEIAGFRDEYCRDGKHLGSVELSLMREIQRLRRMAERVNPTE